jgi:hypothetical protein
MMKRFLIPVFVAVSFLSDVQAHGENTVNSKKTNSSTLDVISNRVTFLKNDLVLKLADPSLMNSIAMRSHRSHSSHRSHRSGR